MRGRSRRGAAHPCPPGRPHKDLICRALIFVIKPVYRTRLLLWLGWGARWSPCMWGDAAGGPGWL